MNPVTTTVFDLPDHLSAKADPTLIAGDERHFAAIAETLERSIAELSERLDAERKAPGGAGQAQKPRTITPPGARAPTAPQATKTPAELIHQGGEQ